MNKPKGVHTFLKCRRNNMGPYSNEPPMTFIPEYEEPPPREPEERNEE